MSKVPKKVKCSRYGWTPKPNGDLDEKDRGDNRKMKIFVFAEPVKEMVLANIPFTVIGSGYNVMIGEKFYRVLYDPHPEPVMFRKEKRVLQGWRFAVEEIIDKETLSLLREGKMAFLALNPELVLTPEQLEEAEKLEAEEGSAEFRENV